ncbi:saccharopine dehydrogenase [Thalassotalea marina]|uniref:Saccharopine dehydrogenase [NAD(+), L-lysine-forming] n=1 Tax=Thalassotalea marina TaxID=1673741 RepID=A0A919BNM5_9GAMM|nr:saccharopine dehydrogenase [Thalassotalea marina]GHF99542.1 saccharopine dehydrogenase [Thalassotalea marina]
MSQTHLWLRAETKPQEQRTALTPKGAKTLIDAGFKVSVEHGQQNIFDIEQYRNLGCEIVAQGSWRQAPDNAFILGLKELPDDTFPLVHKHIYFAHAYKQQSGANAILSRFKQGDGQLYDLEFLVDENQRRIAAFGYWAGFAGAALAVWAWANKQLDQQVLPSIHSYAEKSQLIEQVSKVLNLCPQKPKVMIIGAKGRSGCGALALANALQLTTIAWDMAETAKGGPFEEINQADVLVNCVLVNQDLPPFVTMSSLDCAERKLSVIADVSCDPYGDYNPIRIYDHCTSFSDPTIEVMAGNNSLHLIAIDHLPSLLPKESSEDYGEQLVPYLLSLNELSRPVWQKALAIYQQNIQHL